ncbi:MAG: penicillin-binding protein 2 [Prevotellaceae bacterium]|nr:penicillin-binding protein 2 [Candidatus Faecinaster equi]
MISQNYVNRKFIIAIIAVCIVMIYIIRLFCLQILDDTYRDKANSNALFKNILHPARGLIYDRNGKLMVYNEPTYNLMVVMEEQHGIDTIDFCNTLGITKEDYIQRMNDIKEQYGYSRHTPQIFMRQIQTTDFFNIHEKLFKFKGFYTEKLSVRRYATDIAAHVLGDVGEVSQTDIDSNEYYSLGDYIGKLGVEQAYEEKLRGERGIKVMLRDVHGKIKGSYKNGELDKIPIAGKSLTLSIDSKLQELGEYLMHGKRGAIVAIEPSTGEVLCMVSAPTFNPKLLTGPERGKNYYNLYKNPSKPLLNRAIMGQYPAGSTFKTSQGLTFLQEGIITPYTYYPCHHGFSLGRTHVGCHGHHSPSELLFAIETSCNGYFCWGFLNMMRAKNKYGNVHNAFTRWKDYMVSMGFGYKLGIDLPGEKRGMIPNSEYYDKAYDGRWNGLTIISDAIGQGEVCLTPLQIANLGATIANRGYFITPHVVKKIEHDKLDTLYTNKRYTMVDSKYYNLIVEGMRRAVTSGTCTSARRPWYEVCGKTGTAQNRGQDHSVFMGFAPRNNPKIAICVYVENGGFGAHYGVPIGGLMIEQYINGKLSESSKATADKFASKVIYGYK